ncbi:hypothetical protein TNCV_3679261 [Trichonephila clavipes]|nr:hypothetical protein TNCV_3679261 [Trichonephila clavipes]
MKVVTSGIQVPQVPRSITAPEKKGDMGQIHFSSHGDYHIGGYQHGHWLQIKSFPRIKDFVNRCRVGRNQITGKRICDRWMLEGTTDRRG